MTRTPNTWLPPSRPHALVPCVYIVPSRWKVTVPVGRLRVNESVAVHSGRCCRPREQNESPPPPISERYDSPRSSCQSGSCTTGCALVRLLTAVSPVRWLPWLPC